MSLSEKKKKKNVNEERRVRPNDECITQLAKTKTLSIDHFELTHSSVTLFFYNWL